VKAGTTNALVWSYPLQKHVMSTPAIVDDCVFIADCGRSVHCLDLATGRNHWTQEIRGDVWASTYIADNKVYLGTRSGDFWVFAASKEKKMLNKIEIGTPMSGTATAANGILYVATASRLYAIEARSK
jgi:outer membrane protein assembly factor BamB